MAMTDLKLYAYNHTCLGPHRQKQTKPGTKTQAKPKNKKHNFRENVWF